MKTVTNVMQGFNL